MGFHPDPGNYEIYLPEGVQVSMGAVWSFACPACHHDLLSPLDADLCEILRQDDTRTERVHFSRTAGRQATLVLTSGGDAQAHGSEGRSLAHLTTRDAL
jgi:hypothetical protein